jgi:hypothetical protein
VKEIDVKKKGEVLGKEGIAVMMRPHAQHYLGNEKGHGDEEESCNTETKGLK